MNVQRYATLVFDCDGVVLNSNRIKTEAFRRAATPYGVDAADALVAYHVKNGGISRYKKFEYFLSNVVADRNGPGLEGLLAAYTETLWEGLMCCDVAHGLDRLRRATRDARWLVVSGGDQSELREIFMARGLSEYFDGGIFGSPDSKDIILMREKEKHNIRNPALFFGDSRYDFDAAWRAGIDFTFVSGWTELENWKGFVEEIGINYVERLEDVLCP